MVGPFVLLDLTGQAGSDRCGEFEQDKSWKNIGEPWKIHHKWEVYSWEHMSYLGFAESMMFFCELPSGKFTIDMFFGRDCFSIFCGS